jgi:tetratricopeptide (TPR) repeat protein
MKQRARSARPRWFPAILAAALFLILAPAHAEADDLDIIDCIEPVPEDLQAPLFSGLGDASYPITTRGPDAEKAQRYFTQGMTLLYAFNHPEAIHAFAQAARFDGAAPMAYWGIAMAAGPDINTGATQGCYKLALVAVANAIEKAEAQLLDGMVHPFDASRELAYAKALEQRYRQDAEGELQADTEAYALAMKEVMARFPDDLDAATLYAAALMNITPWKWWKDGNPTAEIVEARRVQRHVLARNPDHLGANHYYIHATEESPWPEEALASAERLMELAPAAGHIQHMPAHIYRRIGDHARATEANYAAVAVDRAYIRQTPATARYPLHYLSHNQHFLTISLTIEGRESEAIASAQQLFELTRDYANDPYNQLFNQTLADVKNDYFFAVPIETAVRFRRWDVLAAFEKEEGASRLIVLRNLSFTAAIWAYAGVLRNLDEEGMSNTTALEGLDAFWTAVDSAPPELTNGNNSAADLFKIANLTLLAQLIEAAPKEDLDAFIEEVKLRLAQSPVLQEEAALLDGAPRDQLVIDLWQQAVAGQDALAYNEPPDWYFPLREALGAAFFRQGRFAEAEAAFRANLERHRGSGRALHGLIESLSAQGKTVPDWLRAQFRRAWKNATAPLSLAKM